MKFKKSLVSLLSTAVVMPTACNTATLANSSNLSQTNLENSTSKIQNFSKELKKIRDLGFTVHGKKISENTSLNLLKLDLLEYDNLNIALKSGIQFMLNDQESPYIDDKSCIVDPIRNNTLIHECLQSTLSYIEKSNVDEKDKNLELFKRLHTIEAMLKSDKNIPEDNQALQFISSMRCAYQVVISRKVAEEILAQHRDSMEQTLGSTVDSADLDASADILGIGLSAGTSTNQGATESAFYKIDNSGNLGIQLSTGLGKYLSANIGCALGITNSLIFYSLEQFLDTGMADGNTSFLKLTDQEIKKVISARKDMQDAETLMIPKMQNSIEHFLKSANIIPQKLMLTWPKQTNYSANEKSSEFNVKSHVGAAASCLASLGFNVSAEASMKKTKTLHPYLELINENCEVTEYCKNVDDLIKFLNTSKYQKWKETTDAVDMHTNSENKSLNSEALSILIANILGDIKRYNSVLNIMADSDMPIKDKKDAHNVKKEIEKSWIGSGIINQSRHNRENMLKLAISLAAYLKSKSCGDETLDELFTPLYNEIDHLSSLQKFTNKLFINPKSGFNTSRRSKSVAATGRSFLDIPFVGTTDFSVSYSQTESPLYSENSEDITVKTQLPIIQGKIYGSETLREKLKNLITLVSGKTELASRLLTNSLELIDKKFDNVLANYGIEKTLFVPGVLSVNNYMNLDFFLTNISPVDSPENIIPLPNSELITKNDDEIVLKLTKRIDNIVTKLAVDVAGNGVSASKRTGKASSKIGSDTLTFTTNKFNACELGRSSTGIDSLWSKFTQSQKDSLHDMFININDDKSNVRYELQCIYSNIINNIDNKDSLSEDQKQTLKQTAENIFEKFLDACKKLSENTDENSGEELYNNAEQLFSSVLKINYEYVWLPALASANSL